MTDAKCKITVGEKGFELYQKLAEENQINPKFFIWKLITREARAECAILTADRLSERLKLIDDVEDELVAEVNKPPQCKRGWRSTHGRAVYQKLYSVHKRLAARGMDREQIHAYCLANYGEDIEISNNFPQRRPKRTHNGTTIKVKELDNGTTSN